MIFILKSVNSDILNYSLPIKFCHHQFRLILFTDHLIDLIYNDKL